MNIKTHLIQLSKYGVFGIIATLIHLLTAWGVIYLFTASVFVSNSVAFFTAFIFSYIFQTLYVFQSHFHLKKFLRFFAVQFGTFLLSYFVSNLLKLANPYYHTVLIVVIIPLMSFFIHKFWTFKEE